MLPKPADIPAYIDAAPPQAQEHLLQMYSCIRKLAPRATEGLKWGMPAFSGKRILVTFAGFKQHIGFYPTPSTIKAFEKELLSYTTAANSVQFPHDTALPLSL